MAFVSGGVWALGDPAAPSDGGIQLAQASIGQSVGPGTFWYLAPAPLPAGARYYDERLTVYSAVDANGHWRNHYSPSGPLENVDHAAYLKPLSGTSMTLSRQINDGTTVQAGEAVPGGSGDSILVFSSVGASGQTLRVEGTAPGSAGVYELALYPVVRSGSTLTEALTPGDRVTTNRAAATQAGRWSHDDYLLRGVEPGHQIAIKVVSTEFVPFIEIRFLDEKPDPGNFASGGDFNLSVEGTAGVARNYLIRVTSLQSGAFGAYQLRVGRAPSISGFQPTAGAPGTRVRVVGSGFLDGLNSDVESVWLGAIEADIRRHPDVSDDTIDMEVPPNAVTGLIRVQVGASWSDAISATPFVVLATVGEPKSEPNGGFSFGVTNAGNGVRLVVEATSDVTPPIAWQRLATNTLAGAGLWRYTNSEPQIFRQRFYRAVRE